MDRFRVQMNNDLYNCPEIYKLYARTSPGRDQFCTDPIPHYYSFTPSHEVQLQGMQVIGAAESIHSRVTDVIDFWLQQQGDGICYHLIESDQNGFRMVYGCESRQGKKFAIKTGDTILKATTKDLSAVFDCGAYNHCYNGFVVNLGTKHTAKYDAALKALQGQTFTICFFSVPIDSTDITQEVENLQEYLNRLNRLHQQQRIGQYNAFDINAPFAEVEQAKKAVGEALDLLNSQGKTIPRYLYAWVCAHDFQTYKEVVDKLKALCLSDQKSAKKPYLVGFGPQRNGLYEHKLPCQPLCNVIHNSIWGNHFASVSTLEQTVSWFLPPLQEHDGYALYHQARPEPHDPFGRIRPVPAEPHFILGYTLEKRAIPYELQHLKQHMLVSGMTASGKTNTAMHILQQAHDAGLRFVVIEAEQKNYWKMISNIPIRVYGGADQALPLYINPFVPENGTIIDNHIQTLIQAFASTFEQVDPLPQALHQLVYACYQKRGIPVTERANSKYRYPVMQDMLDLVDEVLDTYTDKETHDRVRDALTLRLKVLCSDNLMGQVVNGKKDISFADLYSTSAIIELEDYNSTSDKQFLALILAIRAYEFFKASPRGTDTPLTHLLLIEEAHHVLRKESNDDRQTVSVGKYFANMLADVRAYGAGMIVVDQHIEQLNSGALTNTGTKLIHQTNGPGITVLRDQVLQPTLADLEIEMLGSFQTGEAILSVAGDAASYRIRIPKYETSNAKQFIWKIFAEDLSATLPRAVTPDCTALFGRDSSLENLQASMRYYEGFCYTPLTTSQKLLLANQLCCCAGLNAGLIRQYIYSIYQSFDR